MPNIELPVLNFVLKAAVYVYVYIPRSQHSQYSDDTLRILSTLLS